MIAKILIGAVALLVVDTVYICAWDINNSNKNWFEPFARGELR
jgi:hypothetical protein